MIEPRTKWTAVSLLVITAGGLASTFFLLQQQTPLAILCALVSLLGFSMLLRNALLAAMLLTPSAIIVPLLGVDIYRSGTVGEALLFLIFATAFIALAGLVMFGLFRDPDKVFDSGL